MIPSSFYYYIDGTVSWLPIFLLFDITRFLMKARYYVLLLVLIFFRGIVIEAAKKSRPKGDVTKDQIQSPTPGSNNIREYSVEHTPELEEPSQKKIRRQGNSKRKSTAMSLQFDIEAARSKNALSTRAYRMRIISPAQFS